jgi:hypothetical protein
VAEGNAVAQSGGRTPNSVKAERARSVLLEEANRLLPITENGERTYITAYRAVLRSAVALAARGNSAAQRDFIDRVEALEREADSARLATYQAALEFSEQWKIELHRRKLTGQKNGLLPDILLEDLEINHETGEVRVVMKPRPPEPSKE